MIRSQVWSKMYWGDFLRGILFQPINSPSPPNSRELMNQLDTKAISFIRQFETHRHQMQQSVQNCQRMSDRIRERRTTQKLCLCFSALLGLETLIVGVAIVLDQGTSAIQTMIACTALPLLMCGFLELDENAQKYRTFVNSSIGDFRGTVSRLNVELEEVKRVSEELCRCQAGSDRERLIRLQQSVLEVSLLAARLTETLGWRDSAERASEVREEYSRTLSELDRMKIRLSFYTREL